MPEEAREICKIHEKFRWTKISLSPELLKPATKVALLKGIKKYSPEAFEKIERIKETNPSPQQITEIDLDPTKTSTGLSSTYYATGICAYDFYDYYTVDEQSGENRVVLCTTCNEECNKYKFQITFKPTRKAWHTFDVVTWWAGWSTNHPITATLNGTVVFSGSLDPAGAPGHNPIYTGLLDAGKYYKFVITGDRLFLLHFYLTSW